MYTLQLTPKHFILTIQGNYRELFKSLDKLCIKTFSNQWSFNLCDLSTICKLLVDLEEV